MSNSGIDMSMLATFAMVGGGANILVYCIGFVAAIIFWQKAPRSAAICIGAMLLLLAIQAGMPLLRLMLARQMGVADFANVHAILNMIFSLVHAIGIGALITAIFLDRRGTLRV